MSIPKKRIITPHIVSSDSSGISLRLILVIVLILAWTWAAYQFGRDGFELGIIDPPEQVLDSGRQLEQLRSEYKALKRRADAIGKSGQEMSNAQKMAADEAIRLQDDRTKLIKEMSTLNESAAAHKLQLSIKDVEIRPGSESGSFEYKVTVEPLKGVDGVTTGMLKLAISGATDGNPTVIEVPQSAGGLADNHRVFSLSQDLTGILMLPDEFLPEAVTLELITGDDTANPLTHRYGWPEVLSKQQPDQDAANNADMLIEDLKKENLALKIKLAKTETVDRSGEGSTSAGTSTGNQQLEELEQQRDSMAREIEQLKQKVSELRGKFVIKDISLKPKGERGGIEFNITITRSIIDGKRLNGVMTVSLAGTEDEEEKVYTLDQLTSDQKVDYKLGFKNYQEIKQPLLLPKGFVPGKIMIHIAPENTEIEELNQEFDWKALAGESKPKKS